MSCKAHLIDSKLDQKRKYMVIIYEKIATLRHCNEIPCNEWLWCSHDWAKYEVTIFIEVKEGTLCLQRWAHCWPVLPGILLATSAHLQMQEQVGYDCSKHHPMWVRLQAIASTYQAFVVSQKIKFLTKRISKKIAKLTCCQLCFATLPIARPLQASKNQSLHVSPEQEAYCHTSWLSVKPICPDQSFCSRSEILPLSWHV